MNLEFIPTDYFARELKRLAKRYRGLADDYKEFLNSLKASPLQGTEIAPHIRKIRMPITAKGRGKSGGARVITYHALIAEREGKIYLLLIYDKADSSNIKMHVVKQMVKDLGL